MVSDIVPFHGVTKEELLACMSGIEAFSEHPIAESIIKQASVHKAIPHQFKNFKAIFGKGVKGDCTICSDMHHCVGNLKFITQEHRVEKEIIQESVCNFEKYN